MPGSSASWLASNQDHRNGFVKHTPWTPEEEEPEGGRPPVADAVPVVVRAWALLDSGEARPDVPTTGGFGFSLKQDWSRLRAGRFAESWRALLRDGATRDTMERLHRAGMLLPVKRSARAP
jgi:hypothetical protein